MAEYILKMHRMKGFGYSIQSKKKKELDIRMY